MFRTGHARRLICAACACIFGATAAAAHPHVWIKNRTDVIFDDNGMITGIAVEWAFDKEYSKVAIEGLDANDDGYYSAGELHPLAAENISALKDYDYFVYPRHGKDKLKFAEVTEFGQVHSNEVLKLYFTAPLEKPVDPKAAVFNYRVYDPTFYIAIDYPDAAAISAVGKRPAECKVELHKPPSDEKTEETRQMLSDKPPDWQPEVDQDFGAMFAEPVVVLCKRKTAGQ